MDNKDKSTAPKANEPESLENPASGSEQSVIKQTASTGTSPSPTQSGGPSLDTKTSFIRRILDFPRLYILVFILVFIIAGMTVYLSLNLAKQKSSNNASKTTSLTSGQLAQLQGNTTLVGDAKQTLDIQGNTIFEGQGLYRNDLSVASALKVGGAISGQSLNIGGAANFSQLQVSGTLSVNGDATTSGQLTVQKNLTVNGGGSFSGNLTVSQLTAQGIQINGDFNLSHHIVTNGSTPSRTGGTALGNGGTASVSGSDTAGTIDINIGSGAPAGNLVTVNFTAKFAKVPHVVVTPVGSGAAGLQYYVNRTVNGFTLATANAPTAGSSFSFDYIVVD